MNFLERFWFGCGQCRGLQDCPLSRQAQPDSAQLGAGAFGLVGATMLVFICPLIVALSGAYLASRFGAGNSALSVGLWQAGGAVAGFFAGVGLAKLVFRAGRRGSRQGRPSGGGWR